MLHGHVSPSAGPPARIGAGTGSGSRGATTGSHRCSWTMSPAAAARLGSRTASSSPSRYMKLSHPYAISRTGRWARSGCWASSSRRTSSGDTLTSAAGMR